MCGIHRLNTTKFMQQFSCRRFLNGIFFNSKKPPLLKSLNRWVVMSKSVYTVASMISKKIIKLSRTGSWLKPVKHNVPVLVKRE